MAGMIWPDLKLEIIREGDIIILAVRTLSLEVICSYQGWTDLQVQRSDPPTCKYLVSQVLIE